MINVSKLLASCTEEFGTPHGTYQIDSLVNVGDGEWQVHLVFWGEENDEYWLRLTHTPGLLADALEIALVTRVPRLLDIDPTVLEERANDLNAGSPRFTRVTVRTERVPVVIWVASIVITESLTPKALREQVQMLIIDMHSAVDQDLADLASKESAPEAASEKAAKSWHHGIH